MGWLAGDVGEQPGERGGEGDGRLLADQPDGAQGADGPEGPVPAEAGHDTAGQPRADESAAAGGGEGEAVSPVRQPELAKQHMCKRRASRARCTVDASNAPAVPCRGKADMRARGWMRAKQKRPWYGGPKGGPTRPRRVGQSGGSASTETLSPESPVPFMVSTASHSGRRTSGGNTSCSLLSVRP